MTMLMRATLFAAATAAATLFDQPVLSASVQPRLIISNLGETAKLVDLVKQRGGFDLAWAKAGEIAGNGTRTGRLSMVTPALGICGPPMAGAARAITAHT